MARNNRSGLDFDISDLLESLTNMDNRMEAAIMAYAETGAQKLQNYAKTHAKWTDRTGAARQRLNAKARRKPNEVEISLAHGVEYGIWLELANEKRYSIIPDTLRIVGANEIMPGFQNLIDRMRRG